MQIKPVEILFENLKKNLFVCLALFVAIIGTLSGRTYLWQTGGFELLPSGSYSFLVVLILLLLAVINKNYKEVQTGWALSYSACIAVMLVFLSDWLTRGYSLFQAPSIRGEIIFFSLLAMLLLHFRTDSKKIWIAIMLFVIFAIIYQFIVASAGRIIFSDDHSVFTYRLEQLVQSFPNIPLYNPLWDAGHDARDAFATGALGLFVLGLPFIYFIPVEFFYNYLLIWIIFIQLPLGVYLAGKLLNFTTRASAISSLLVLACSLHWYRWALKYGTMGFINGTSLVTLVLALGINLLVNPEFTKKHWLLFVVCFSLCIFWPFYAVVLLPMLVMFFYYFCRSLLNKNKTDVNVAKRLSITALVLLVIHLPWMTIFVTSSGMIDFLKANKPAQQVMQNETELQMIGNEDDVALLADIEGGKRKFRKANGHVNLRESLKVLRTIIFSSNPVLIFLGIAGVLIMTGMASRLWKLQLAWIFLLGAILFPIKPQFELDRLLIVFLILLALPAGMAIDLAINGLKQNRNAIPSMVVALTLGFVFTGPLVVVGVVRNRSVEHYDFADQMVQDFIVFLQEYKPTGRILFSGCVIHEFGGGHLAPLAYHTGHQFIASSRAHTLWWYKDIFPSDFLIRGDEGKEDFLNLYNASDIFAHEKRWKKYFQSKPDQYELVWSKHGFDLYRRKNYSSNYFVSGQGQILEQGPDRVVMKVSSDSAKIKFKYNVALQAGQCTITPYRVYEDIDFVELTNCGKDAFELKAMPPFKQIFLKDRKSIT